ncbi:class I SAM-dependent methyltransferase [Providencia rettgeri]|nr:class I SAM-dependent methyltransferase [Providencia rettgeri]
MEKKHDYNAIGSIYEEFNRTSPARLAEVATVEQLLGDVSGKSVLDLACGYGFFGRAAYEQGADRVVGVDISQSMINQAKDISRQQNEAIEFRVGDVLEMGVIGQFDRAIAAFLFNYARSVQELEQMFQAVADNLKPDGRLVAYTVNPDFQLGKEDVAKYGLKVLTEEPYQEGFRHTAHFNVGPPIQFTYHRWGKQHYEAALKKAGFRSFRWQAPLVTQQALDAYPPGFWDNYGLNCPQVSLLCER